MLKIFYRKKKFILIIFLTIFFFILFTAITTYAHKKPVILDNVEDISFSRESGFYDNDFYLKIYSPRGEVYYSLDGTDPTNKSIYYTEPIHIGDASNNENVYSMRQDTSAGFKTELIRKYSRNDPNYKVPDFLVDKCTIVRAVVYYGNDRYSNIKSASYFVGFDNKRGYNNLNFCSIISDPENFFGYENGIMVLGKNFDAFVQEELESKTKVYSGPNWWWWTSNYSRGIATEKNAVCQFFQNNKLILSQQIGINIRGGYSRGFAQKSFNLYTRKKYGKNSHFAYNFFGNDFFPTSLTLFNGGNEYMGKIKDYIMNNLCHNLNFSTMNFSPYVVFIDGEYWGCYWLTEKYDKQYIKHYYHVLPDNIIMVKNGAIEEGSEDDIDLYKETISFIQEADFSLSKNYEKLKTLIDINSFIDYHAAMIYIARYADWNYETNTAIWRSRKIGEGLYNDGKWRWMLFDVNSGGLTEDLIDFDTFNNCLKTNPIFCSLMQNNELKNKLLDKIVELKQTTFSKENVEKILKCFHETMDEPMELNHKRFWGEGHYSYFKKEINSVEMFLEHRADFIDIMVEKYR